MKDISIKVENLSKVYKLGQQTSGSLFESFSRILKSNKKDPSMFWALDNVSFEIGRGEAVAVIGKNGAGKSTLLKILSRITQPTTGRITIDGRLSSLLEVGTGFHPELTGRENIFLNGTILGMTRQEVRTRFDEIVEFSGVEKFLNTPVKHYSSGMYVRLAFAVAAHLNPEILIIDEVLAVGDSSFQAKCINKMSDVVKMGKTVLFVSHNMQAVKNLCTQGIFLEGGKIVQTGDIDTIIKSYHSGLLQNSFAKVVLTKDMEREKKYGNLIFEKVVFDKTEYFPGDSLDLKIYLRGDDSQYKDLLFGLNIIDEYGASLFHLSNLFLNKVNISHESNKYYSFTIPQLNLRPGTYEVRLFLKANEEIQDWIKGSIVLIVSDGNVYNFANSKMITGIFQPSFQFQELYD